MTDPESALIKVIRESGAKRNRKGMFAYRVPSLGLSGKSRQPLLDACRQIKRILGPTTKTAGLFREGHDAPDMTCRVDAGAGLTVEETQKLAPHFRKYRPFEATAPDRIGEKVEETSTVSRLQPSEPA